MSDAGYIEDMEARMREHVKNIKCPKGHTDLKLQIAYFPTDGKVIINGCCTDYEILVEHAIDTYQGE